MLNSAFEAGYLSLMCFGIIILFALNDANLKEIRDLIRQAKENLGVDL